MTAIWVFVGVGLVAVAAVAIWLIRRQTDEKTVSSRGEHAHGTPSADLETASATLEPEDRTLPTLEQVLSSGEANLMVPVGEGTTFLELAAPASATAYAASAIPTQLARLAVTGQAGVDAMVKAGQLSGRLVTVDAKTAAAIRQGTMVTDKAGEILGIIRGSNSRFGSLTRIKPVSGSLIKSASSGPAVLSAIAMQAQLANVEKAIADVSSIVSAMWTHVQQAERDALDARRKILASVYRTAMDSQQMTQALWDQIQDLETQLVADVSRADRAVEEAARDLSPDARGVSGRLSWLELTAPSLAGAVNEAAAARRAHVQFAMLRLWWLAVSDDPSLASRQAQIEEELLAMPDHASARLRVESLIEQISQHRRHHRVTAPRKYKELGPAGEQSLQAIESLPWSALGVQRELTIARPDIDD